MEIREFAERVLFSRSLEEKLLRPDSFSDEQPQFAFAWRESMPRPSQNLYAKGTCAQSFPKWQQLEKPEHLARAMHFFANHELLAMELMALCLLKFPEAPKAFRRGLAQEILEEAEHLQLYRARMQEQGKDFYDFSANDYFWRMLSGMSHPLEFCSQMSLCFEQANLDFASYFRDLFARLGDKKTAALLDRVYEDEIRHVSFGLHWFKKWCSDPAPDLFTKHKNSLVYPMGLQRAKALGKAFDVKSRQRVGFDADYIRKLQLYSASKERPPVLRYFNPEVEASLVVRHEAYTPDKITQNLKDSLQHLPLVFALAQDIVLCRREPSLWFLQQLQGAGVCLPEFILEKDWLRQKNHRKLDAFRPWGDSRFLRNFVADSDQEAYLQRCQLQAPLHSQTVTKEILWSFCQAYAEKYPYLTPPSHWGQTMRSVEDLATWTQYPAVIKAPLALSGRGLRFVANAYEAEKACSKILQQQGEFYIEPEWQRVFDFSLQLRFHGQSKQYESELIRFFSGPQGGYQGGVVGRNFFAGAEEDLKRFWYQVGPQGDSLNSMLQDLQDFLCPILMQRGQAGALGVDCFVYKKEGEFFVQPLVEINLRHNMGGVCASLQKYIKPGANFIYRVIRKSQYPALLSAGIEQWQTWQAEAPLVKTSSGLQSGLLLLSDPLQGGEDFVALMIDALDFPDSEKKLRQLFIGEA